MYFYAGMMRYSISFFVVILCIHLIVNQLMADFPISLLYITTLVYGEYKWPSKNGNLGDQILLRLISLANQKPLCKRSSSNPSTHHSYCFLFHIITPVIIVVLLIEFIIIGRFVIAMWYRLLGQLPNIPERYSFYNINLISAI